jgi:phosphate starvation-inducible PhoH-like protein
MRRPIKKVRPQVKKNTYSESSKKGDKKDQRQRTSVRSVEGVTENHNQYIMSILHNDITICIGPAGSGKSYIGAGMFANFLHEKKFSQIIATRPLVSSGKEVGSLPGDLSEKVAPYLKPMEENLKSFLGIANYGLYFNDGCIRYEPLELMRGATYNDSCMILDEAQNCTLDQLKMFITRMGRNSKVVINGDVKQTDIKSKSGLGILVERLARIDGVGVITLTYEDIQRNGIIGRVLQALEE